MNLLVEYARIRVNPFCDAYATLLAAAPSGSQRKAYLAELSRVHALFTEARARWQFQDREPPKPRESRVTQREVQAHRRYERAYSARLNFAHPSC